MRYIISLCLLLAVLPGYAHGPTPQKGHETITINAPVDKVWAAVKQFDAIAVWHPDLKSSQGEDKNESGGTRRLTFQNGESLVEELDDYDETEHKYNYRIKTENTAALPVSSHSTELKVTAGETPGSSVVTIKSRFYRGDTGNAPADTLNDEAAVKAMTDFFKNGLNGLKSKVE